MRRAAELLEQQRKRLALLTLVRDAIRGWLPFFDGTRSDAGIPTDARHRREQLAKLGTSGLLRLRIAQLRGRLAGEDRKKEIVEEALVRTAADAYEVVGNMKGTMMKLAQFASFQPQMPEAAREQLKALQTAAPAMTPELASSCIERELGARPDEVFTHFEMEPIASASIGQVHRAITRERLDVAVKVQYPGVDDAIRSDLSNATMVIKTMTAAAGEDADFSEHLEEVAGRVGEELDYELEARNQRWFADRYRGHPFVKIPDVVDDLTTSRVLTTEFVRGRGFYDVLDDPQEQRDRFGEIIFRFAFTSVFCDGVFSGDPHPGNYLFCDDGGVCFLDFGLVKRMDDTERALLRGPMEAIVTGDRAHLRSSLEAIGVLKPTSEIDADMLWKLFVRVLGPVDEDRPMRSSLDDQRDGPDDMDRERRRALRRQLDFPATVLFFMRYRRGTWSVLAHLGAEANWHRIMREILFGDPPSTPIGDAWRRADRG